MAQDDELDQELELLRSMWSSDELDIIRCVGEDSGDLQDLSAARLIARLAPNTDGNNQSQYLRCEVIITLPCGYPGEPEHPVLPQLRIGASSGLTDARRTELLGTLEDMLRGDLAGVSGALLAVLEAALERITAWNDEGPVGECPVCLAEFHHGDNASGQADGLLRLPCFHVLHTACFAQLWGAEWLRQKDEANIAISDTSVGCPECRQVASWMAVPQIHEALHHLVAPVPINNIAVGSDNQAEAEGTNVRADESEIPKCSSYSSSSKKRGAAKPQVQQQHSATVKVDLFEVTMQRGLRTRLKPKWDARDHDGPVLRTGACGVVAEYVEGKDATYLRPENADYWLPISGGRNDCKMVRIDKDMPRPHKAPNGWIHGDSCLAEVVKASSSPKASTAKATVAPTEAKASGKDRKKKAKDTNPGCGYAPDSLLGA